MKKLLLILTAFLLVVIQTSMSPLLEIINVAPNLIFIFAIIYGINTSPFASCVAGCILGLITDCVDFGIIGYNALLLMYVSFFSSLVSNKFYYNNRLVGVVVVFVSGLIYESLRFALANFLIADALFSQVLLRYILPEAVMNSVLCVPLMWWIKWLKNEYIRGI